MMIIVIATMFCNSRHWPWVSIMREATKDMLPLPVTPWQGNTLTRWHGDTTPAPRHGVGSRLDSCVAQQDGNPKPPSNPTAFKVRNLRKPSAKSYLPEDYVRNPQQKEMRPETVLPPRKQRHCCRSQHAEPLVCRPPAIHRWFVTRHLKYQSPDCVSWIQSTCYQLQCWSFFLRWHRLINASNEETCT